MASIILFFEVLIMEIRLYRAYARFAVVEIIDGGHFLTRNEYELYLNGKFWKEYREV